LTVLLTLHLVNARPGHAREFFPFGIKTVLTNDDGWAVANIHAHFNALVKAGFDVVMSAPAENESGTGSSDAPATVLGAGGCEFGSCPAGAPADGFNASEPRLNYVNSFPVDAVRFGIQQVAPKFFFGRRPDFVVSGPNVGANLGTTTLVSGTVGAACEAAKEGVPSVAFSGKTGSQVPFTSLITQNSSTIAANVYAALSVKLSQQLLATPATFFEPILPKNITLNVNFGSVTNCTTPEPFKFVFTRINTPTNSTAPDVRTCGTDRLPTETTVVDSTTGCFASVSVMDAVTKDDVDANTQAFVLRKLELGGRFLSCFTS